MTKDSAAIDIAYKGDPEHILEEITTNESGRSDLIQLPAPALDLSLEPSAEQPYSEYNITDSVVGLISSSIIFGG